MSTLADQTIENKQTYDKRLDLSLALGKKLDAKVNMHHLNEVNADRLGDSEV